MKKKKMPRKYNKPGKVPGGKVGPPTPPWYPYSETKPGNHVILGMKGGGRGHRA